MGFLFLLSLFLMLLMAINYQSNLIYALTFWLGTLFVVAIHVTHANLSGLEVTALRAEPCFAGELAVFQIRLVSGGRSRQGIRLGWSEKRSPETAQNPERRDAYVDIAANDAAEIALHYPALRRGWCYPDRLRIEATFPLGLLRCWSFIMLDQRALVWPAPVSISTLLPVADASDQRSRVALIAEERDLAGHRHYRIGDPASAIDWRSLARGQPLSVEQYFTPTASPRWLDWDAMPSADPERKLSELCGLALQAAKDRSAFGLKLPGQVLEVGLGQEQLEQVLTLLALFRLADRAPIL